MNKILSIIIPVYKVERYIRKCLDSLIVSDEQMQVLDVVVVNDGTPDNSANIAREYEVRFPNTFRVIDQENRGHGGAWNHGTELATGKYLFYLDSDDWFNTPDFSKLITFLQTCDTDMVLLDRQVYHAATDSYEPITVHHNLLIPNKIYNANDYEWIGCKVGFKMTYAHDTVYRTTMMQQYLPLFCEHVMYDDVSLQVMPITIAKDFVYVPLDVYRYYIGRPGQSFDPKVRAVRAADDVSKVLQFCLAWITKYRAVPPAEGTRRAWMEENYQSMATWHYRELALFDYKTAMPRLKVWDEYVRELEPKIVPNDLVRAYRRLPFWMFLCGFRCSIFVERVERYIKRKMSHRKL